MTTPLPDRVADIRASSALTGIDFIQVSPDQLEVRAFILHTSVPVALMAKLVAITPDQVEIRAVGQIAPAHVPVVAHVTPLASVNGRRALRFTVAAPGGFGYYRLRIDDPAIDTYFNNVLFSFKADCPTELDCKAPALDCPDDASVDFPVDYRARDFWSFRQALIDFAAQRYPDWQDRLEADVAMMLLEVMSALGDEFAYADDRLARERTLEDATQRRSLRHLAALVDYPIDDGSGAFAWIDVQAKLNGTLAAGLAITDARAQVVFELGRRMSDAFALITYAITVQGNSIAPYIWNDDATCIEAGGRALTLSGNHAAILLPDVNIDLIGRWVLLTTTPGIAAPNEPAKPERRIAVRVTRATDTTDPLNGNPITEIEWDVGLPFELDLERLTVHCNLLPATSGETRATTFCIGPAPIGGPPMPSALERVGANHDLTDRADVALEEDADDVPPARRVNYLFSLPDSEISPIVWLPTAKGDREPEVRVTLQGGTAWNWMPALIGERVASVTDEAYTLEDGSYRVVFGVDRLGGRFEFADYANDAGSTIRFGDGEFGLAPADGQIFDVSYRLYAGHRVNVAPDTLTRFMSEFKTPPFKPAIVDSISNPLAAVGGRDPESDDSIRTNAPQDFRQRTYRAVRPEDYAEIAERLPWVQKAGATLRWTGSWATMFVTPDPHEEFGLSRAHRVELEALMDRVRQAGRDVRVLDPRYADVDLEISVCVAPDAYRGEVKARVLVALFGDRHTVGFFDPDNFTFGQPLDRGALLAAIQNVGGVRAVERMRVRRRGYFDWRAFNEFALRVNPNELVRVTNDRLLPERGAVRLIMEGGA